MRSQQQLCADCGYLHTYLAVLKRALFRALCFGKASFGTGFFLERFQSCSLFLLLFLELQVCLVKLLALLFSFFQWLGFAAFFADHTVEPGWSLTKCDITVKRTLRASSGASSYQCSRLGGGFLEWPPQSAPRHARLSARSVEMSDELLGATDSPMYWMRTPQARTACTQSAVLLLDGLLSRSH